MYERVCNKYSFQNEKKRQKLCCSLLLRKIKNKSVKYPEALYFPASVMADGDQCKASP